MLRARFDKLERCIAKVRAALEDFDEDAYLQDTFLQDVVERNLQLASQIVLYKLFAQHLSAWATGA